MRPVLLLAACALTGCADEPDDPKDLDSDPAGADTDPAVETDAVDDRDPPGPVTGPATTRSNVLLVILDDVGPELLGTYAIQPEAAPTPTLDQLAAEGVRFDRAYANPWCSPTRATILTGRYGRRYGFGAANLATADVSVPEGETTLPELIDAASPWTWSLGAFGKWHMSGVSQGLDAPLLHGFHEFTGTLGNLAKAEAHDGKSQDYFDWERVENGALTRTTGQGLYATSVVVDDVLAFVQRAPEPWLAWVGLHAIHTPYHDPPDHLHGYGDLTGADVPTRARAMLEAADTELGRLLDGMDPAVLARTHIIVVGDNGATEKVEVGIYADRPGKSMPYESGTRVPLIVKGPEVVAPGRVVDALVQSTDLFPTLAELAGVDPGATGLKLDGVSFLPHLRDPAGAPRRGWVYLESFIPSGPGPYTTDNRTVRDERWKLVQRNGVHELYDMDGVLLEGADLLQPPLLSADADAAYARLAGILAAQVP